MKSVHLRMLALACLLSLFAAACGTTPPDDADDDDVGVDDGDDDAPSPDAGMGGHVTIAAGYLPLTMDPHYANQLFTVATYSYVYDTLTTTDDTGGVQPSLATEWENTEPQVWEFKLREGVEFHNGEPFNAEVAAYTIQRVIDEDAATVWAGLLTPVDSAEAIDDTTLRITTTRPMAELPGQLSVIAIIPPEHVEAVGSEGLDQDPIGTGPFKVTNWVTEDVLQLERNEDYWGEVPQLESVEIVMAPEESTRLAGLETGEFDIAYPISPDQVDRIDGIDGVDANTISLAQNQAVAIRAVGTGPLEDKRVRQALNYAVDVEALHRNLMHGQGRILDAQLGGPETFGYNPDLDPYPYDPDRARELLAEAGYPDGFETTLQGAVGVYPKDGELAEAIVGQLAEVGVDVTYEVTEFSGVVEAWFAGTVGPLYVWGWNNAPVMSTAQPYFYHVSEHSQALLASDEFDELYERQGAEFDVDAREEILRELGALVADEAVSIFLWQIPMIVGVSSDLEDFGASAAGRFALQQIRTSS